MFDFRLRGAKVEGFVNVPQNSITLAPFNITKWDSDGFHRPTENINVLKVPIRRLAGRYKIRVAVRWFNPWFPASSLLPQPTYDEYFTYCFEAFIRVNGTRLHEDARATAAGVPATKSTTMNFAVDANLGKSDEVEVELNHTYKRNVEASVWLEIRRLGRRVNLHATTAGTPTPSGPEPTDVG